MNMTKLNTRFPGLIAIRIKIVNHHATWRAITPVANWVIGWAVMGKASIVLYTWSATIKENEHTDEFANKGIKAK